MWKYNGSTRPDFAETPGEDEESVWDYPRPPIVSPDHRLVEVHWMGQRIARTKKSVRVLETASPPTFYLPSVDVDEQFLRESTGSSFCEWKGQATYWNIELNGRSLQKAAWSYEKPNPSFRSITGYYSFYPARVNCTVDGIRVKAQPGSFYGGWMTPEVIGPVKGEPGSSGW